MDRVLKEYMIHLHQNNHVNSEISEILEAIL